MAEPLLRELNRLRALVLDPDVLVKAVASGRQKGEEPRWRRAELRYVDLKAGRPLQVTTYDATQAFTATHAVGDAARDAVDALLDEPFGHGLVVDDDPAPTLKLGAATAKEGAKLLEFPRTLSAASDQ